MSSINEPSSNLTADETVAMAEKASLWARCRGAIRQFRVDLKTPLPGAESMTRWQRIKARTLFLIKRHGWKLVAVVVIYYLIRDTILYIIIPYLVARKLLG